MKTWTRFPFVRLLFPLLAGIVLYGLFPVIPGAGIVSLSIVTSLFLIFILVSTKVKVYRFRWTFGFGLNAFFVCLGYFLSLIHNEQTHAAHFMGYTGKSRMVYSAVLTEEPAERENSYKFPVEVNGLFVDGKYFVVKGNVLAYAQKDALVASLVYGSEILFSVSPEPVRKPSNPGEFNYARYLAVNNVFHQVYFAKGSFTCTGNIEGYWLKKLALKARNRLLVTLKQYGIVGREFAVAAALLIGYDDLLDASQRQEYAGAGVVHILCVSGLHVGIVFLIADFLFYFLRKQKKAVWLRPLLIILVIWLYALITGLAPSVLRASLMFSLITIGKSLNRQSHTFNTLAASAFILLVINPAMLYDLGFQLSYGAVAGIVAFQPHIRLIFITRNKVTSYIWGMINVSIAAQLLVTPISIYYFHQFPNYFLMANLIAIPLSGVLIYSGVIFIFLSFIPLLGKISASIMILQIKLLNSTVAFIEGLPGAVSHNLYLTPFSTIVLYLLLFSCFFGILNRKRFWLYPALAACLMLAADYSFVNIERSGRQRLVVHSIKKQSAISFTSGRNQHMMVDSVVMSDPSMLNYSLSGSRIQSGVKEISYSNLGNGRLGLQKLPELKIYSNGFFEYNGRRGVVLSRSTVLPDSGKQLKLDLVILTGNTRLELQNLKDYFPGARFIADASNSLRKCKFWAQEAQKSGLLFYSVRESGAWVWDVQ
ncbi:MAG: ComEC/Rec2 family competence protein [Bacteroidales bacterium]|nr:ComEC/Rec2 family competence protein [Bacteroidales bacterium]MBK9359271.1 ComEC/Rec2 family competence protein [Bacteroidales bacterium]